MENVNPSYIHTVFFWLKDGTSKARKVEFEKGLIMLGTCPQIFRFYWGPPVPAERDVVDSTFHYAINVHFKSKEDHDAYQKEKIHFAFIDAHEEIWEKVQVFDNYVR